MKKTLEKPTEEISIDQIKKLLEKISPKEVCDKIIITDSQKVKKSDYIFVKFKYQKIVRKLKKIRFPLYDATKVVFSDFEGGLNKFGDKSQIKSDRLFEDLKKNYQITSVGIDSSIIDNPFNFPLDTINDEINPIQKNISFPNIRIKKYVVNVMGVNILFALKKNVEEDMNIHAPSAMVLEN